MIPMKTTKKTARSPLAGVALGLAAAALAGSAIAGPADDRFAAIEIRTTEVAGNVYMIEGAGGNIGVSVGDDGVLMIDDQFAPLGPRIAEAIEELGSGGPRFLLNTHYHGDHTGGNAFFGGDALILAHDNVRVRLLSGNMPPEGLPVVTFRDRLRLHVNGDDVEVLHLPHGHTDGDAVVWFKKAGVIHLGDHLFVGLFPYVDVPGGGSVDGYIANLETVLAMVPEDIRVIPGHGPLSGIDAVHSSLAVIRESQAMVRAAAQTEGGLDALRRDGFGKWEGWGAGFISTERWIDIIVESDQAAR